MNTDLRTKQKTVLLQWVIIFLVKRLSSGAVKTEIMSN